MAKGVLLAYLSDLQTYGLYTNKRIINLCVLFAWVLRAGNYVATPSPDMSLNRIAISEVAQLIFAGETPKFDHRSVIVKEILMTSLATLCYIFFFKSVSVYNYGITRNNHRDPLSLSSSLCYCLSCLVLRFGYTTCQYRRSFRNAGRGSYVNVPRFLVGFFTAAH
ncbi:unnamed protein product [Ixodes pacificus]